MQNKYILICSAIESEVKNIISQIQNKSTSQIGKRKIFSGFINSLPIKILITRIGIVNAVQSVTAVIEHIMATQSYLPSLIIQTGCGGAFKQSGLSIGDVCVATEQIDANLNVNFPVISNFTNIYPLDSKLVNNFLEILKLNSFKINNSNNINIIKCRFLTVSKVTDSFDQADKLYAKFEAYLEEMEGSGVAHIALHYDIPFIAIRSVSNFVGETNKNFWNLPLSFQNCSKAVLLILSNLKHLKQYFSSF